jgi:hypothetical protein
VALTEAVIHAYGWHTDGPDGPPLKLSWSFDRPWIDGTTRYVPDLQGRTELVQRLARRNARRFAEEMDICLEHLLPLMADGVPEARIDRWRKENQLGLNKGEILSVFDFGVEAARLNVLVRGGKQTWVPARGAPVPRNKESGTGASPGQKPANKRKTSTIRRGRLRS